MVVWGTGHACLACLVVSYRTHFSSLVNTIKYGYVAVPRKQQETGSIVIASWLLTICGVPTCSTCTAFLCSIGEVCFIRNLEALSKLTTGLAVVFLYGHLQGLIQDLWLATVEFITKDRVSWPELLEPMYNSVFKGLRYWLVADRATLVIQQRTLNKLLQQQWLCVCACNASALMKSNAPTSPHSQHVRHSFLYQWLFLLTQRKKMARTFFCCCYLITETWRCIGIVKDVF